MLAALLFGCILLLGGRPAGAQGCSAGPAIPGFTIKVQDAGKHHFRPDRVPFAAQGPGFFAMLKQEGSVFSLTVVSESIPVTKVTFPWFDADRYTHQGDRALLPRSLGMAMPTGAMIPNRSYGCVYPGKCFSPMVVHDFRYGATILAAMNWPPRVSSVRAGIDGYGLIDDETIQPGEMRRVRALSATHCGAGAWQAATATYRSWVESVMRTARLLPANQSDDLRHSNGWWSVHLQNQPRFNPDYLQDGWDATADRFGWVQFWGQMSTFAGDPGLAEPPPEPGEETGCCEIDAGLHPRYEGVLQGFMRSVTRAGGRVGLYTRAGPEQLFREDGSESDALVRLRDWFRTHRQRGTNAVYIDVLGNSLLGDALAVARLFADPAFEDAVIEYPVDLYPAAFLCSGSLNGPNWRHEKLVERGEPHAFPRFGRSVLWNRPIFLGQQNGDVKLFLEEMDFLGQRQAFLLGAKLDMTHLELRAAAPGELTRVTDEILDEWEASDWWSRDPVYLDEEGLGIPEGLEARRFRGNAGEELLVVVNWERVPGLGVRVDTQYVPVPARRFSIQVLSLRSAAPSAYW